MDGNNPPLDSARDLAIDAGRSESLFQHRDFMKLWTGETISQFGSVIGGVSISFLAVIALHATPAQMGALTVWRTVPALLFSPFAGVWVDRLRRRPLMIAADVANMVLLGSIPAAAAFGRLRIEQVYVVVFLTSLADILFGVSYHAYLPTLVGRERIARANSILTATEAAAETGGFGIAGWLVQWLTAPIAILVDSISYLFSIAFLLSIGTAEEPPPPRADWRIQREIRDGARAIIEDKRLLALASAATINGVAGGIFGTVYTLFFINELGFTPGPLGVIYATGGAASFFGAALSVRAAERLGPKDAMTLGLLGWGVGYALVSFAHGSGAVSIALLVAQQLIGDFWGTIYSVTHLTLVQQVAPQEKLGRVLAGIRFLRLCAILAGAGLGALLGAAIGLRYVIALGAILVISAGVLIFSARIEAD